jgi:hypothetical protein
VVILKDNVQAHLPLWSASGIAVRWSALLGIFIMIFQYMLKKREPVAKNIIVRKTKKIVFTSIL